MFSLTLNTYAAYGNPCTNENYGEIVNNLYFYAKSTNFNSDKVYQEMFNIWDRPKVKNYYKPFVFGEVNVTIPYNNYTSYYNQLNNLWNQAVSSVDVYGKTSIKITNRLDQANKQFYLNSFNAIKGNIKSKPMYAQLEHNEVGEILFYRMDIKTINSNKCTVKFILISMPRTFLV
jgi:hypothetical protein